MILNDTNTHTHRHTHKRTQTHTRTDTHTNAHKRTHAHTDTHTHTHTHIRKYSSWRGVSLSQRPLPDNTQHSKWRDIHAPGRIRNRNIKKRKWQQIYNLDRAATWIGFWINAYTKTERTVSVAEFVSNCRETYFIIASIIFLFRFEGLQPDTPPPLDAPLMWWSSRF